MRKAALGVVVMTCATGSAVAADMPFPASLYKAPAPAYNWADRYFGSYFAGGAGHPWGIRTNPAFAFAHAGRAADSDVFPPPSAFIGGGQTGAGRRWGDFTGGVFQGVGGNAPGAATAAIPPRCDVAPARCGGLPVQSLSQNPDYLGAMRARPGPADDNPLSVGIAGSNSEGNFNKVRGGSGDGITGVSMRGTMSYKFNWQ
jgi:hypothetical protein